MLLPGLASATYELSPPMNDTVFQSLIESTWLAAGPDVWATGLARPVQDDIELSRGEERGDAAIGGMACDWLNLT